MIRIVVDAMGGDLAPAAAVTGAAASTQTSDVTVLLVGDGRQIRAILSGLEYYRHRLEIVEAQGVIPMDQSPRDALEANPHASLPTAMQLLAEGQADALVTAGNTGACVLSAARSLSRIEGVTRAALAAVYPTERRHGPHGDPFALMLDVGATLEVTAEELVQFAVMGSAYSSVVSRIPRPKVALLSNGEEPTKGRKEIVGAHQLLACMPTPHFIGNVEGIDIPRGTADVVVCDGFVGNVVLKMLEGVSEVVNDLARYALERSMVWRLGLVLLKRGLGRVLELTDWEAYGGAPLLGFSQVVIKAHGRSGSRAIGNAIRVAAKAVRGQLREQIRRGLEMRALGSGSGRI